MSINAPIASGAFTAKNGTCSSSRIRTRTAGAVPAAAGANRTRWLSCNKAPNLIISVLLAKRSKLESGMKTTRKKRALVLTGAGASLEFGAPCTAKLTETIETKVHDDRWMQCCGGAGAYSKISETLANYLQGGADAVNFEHIYHCAHELLSTFERTPCAVNEYRPILRPFIKRRIEIGENALRELVEDMAKFIFAEISAVCEEPKTSLKPLTEFLNNLRVDHITRIYTTNYDDFLWQAAKDLYTGFDCTPSPDADAKRFDGRTFWEATDEDSVFHLHGSVHLGFGPPQTQDADFRCPSLV